MCIRDSGLPFRHGANPVGLTDVRPHPNSFRGIRVGVPMTDLDKGVGDLSNEVLELRWRRGPLMRGDVVLALGTGLVNSACPADHAEKPVERSVLTGATPALFASAPGALDPITDDPGTLVGAWTNHHVTGHDETLSSGEKVTAPNPLCHRVEPFSSH